MDLIRVESSLRFTLTPNKKSLGIFQIFNVSDKTVTYKVKTRHPERYSVGNNHGILQPRSHGDVKIVIEPMEQLPDKNVTDKFLVMHTVLTSEPKDISTMWKDLETKQKRQPPGTYYYQQKIKCRLQVPGLAVNASPEKPNVKAVDDSFTNSTNRATDYERSTGPVYKEPQKIDRDDSRSDQNTLKGMQRELQRKRDEYEELMTYTVKLANENEELKKTMAELKIGGGSNSKIIAEKDKRINELQMQVEKYQNRSQSANSTDGGYGLQATASVTKSGITFRYFELAAFVVILSLVIRYAL
mmetsp:Transcript_43861/g.70522  ORF Transcript_43861/g.70522 Transcript_43861/m.70522 type:complete len:300 (-) Transcript_43861:165-1064(-)